MTLGDFTHTDSASVRKVDCCPLQSSLEHLFVSVEKLTSGKPFFLLFNRCLQYSQTAF